MMRATLIVFFSVLSCLVPVAAAAQRSTLAVDTGLTLSGTPLEIEVTLEGWTHSNPRAVEIYLDGQRLGQRGVPAGTSTLHFAAVRLTSGQHHVSIVSSTVTAEARFRTLPGWLSLLPPLLAIVLALVTRDVLVSLFLGVGAGALVFTGFAPTAALARTIDRYIVGALADGDHASIVIFTTLLGGMVGLITKSGGTSGLIDRLKPYATSSRRGQLATWAMGVAVFFDDYANTLIVGPTMRPITDRLRISREKLAYIVDSTAAPVVCLIPISTWVGFEIGLIGDAFRGLGLPFDAYTSFLRSIPYRFYPMFAIFTVAVVAWTGRDFGAMRRAEKRARDHGKVLADDARPIADYANEAMTPKDGTPPRAINAVLPILTVVGVTLIGLYKSGASGLVRGEGTGMLAWLRQVLENANSYQALLWASLSSVLVALALPLAQRLLRVGEAVGAMLEGFKAMMMALCVLTLAWSLGSVCGDLHTADYLVGLTRDILQPSWVPALTFVLAAAVAFATGASWGAMGILTPLVIPICHNLAISAGMEVGSPAYMGVLSATIASVLSGAVWGDHCSPISDTTILSSMASGCDHIAHVRTQLPYAVAIGGVAVLVGNLPAGFGLRPWVSLVLGAAIITTGVLWLGQRQDRQAARQTEAESADPASDQPAG